MRRFREDVKAELARFGVVPGPKSDPARLRDFLNALYVFEIREQKLRRQEFERVLGPQPLDAYSDGVQALKRKYALLQLPPRLWLEGAREEIS